MRITSFADAKLSLFATGALLLRSQPQRRRHLAAVPKLPTAAISAVATIGQPRPSGRWHLPRRARPTCQRWQSDYDAYGTTGKRCLLSSIAHLSAT
jgi:hypothetical protein